MTLSLQPDTVHAECLIPCCNLIEVQNLLVQCLNVCRSGVYVKMKENQLIALTKLVI